MFRMILYTQWKWSRLIVLLGVVAAFALPILSVASPEGPHPNVAQVRQLLADMESWSVLYPALAGALAVLIAIAAWGADHRGRHVYALSLPLPRWHYALLRFGAGALLLVGPAVALWVGALLASGTANVPPGLHTYPTALALRFVLALCVAYAIIFAISAGTTRTAGYILGGIAALVVLQILATAAGLPVSILPWLSDRLFISPGPFDIFGGRWMLIDV